MSSPNLGDTAACAHCGGVVVNVGPDTWDHVDAADHRATPTTLREQGAIEALRHMTHEATRHYGKRRANATRALWYRREAQERNADLLFEYTARVAAEARLAALEEAIAVHRRDTAAGCQVDAALWRVLEGSTQ